MDAIYARQSVDKKDSVSIEAQIDMCRRECDGEPLIFKDKGYSGKNTERPDFKRMIKAIEAGKITKVVVYRLDRISRSITDFGRVWDILRAHGAEFVSMNEKFDTSTPVGRAMVYIIMVFAQLERETITQRITDNYRFRAHGGVFMGGNTPYGYISERIEIDGRNVPVLRIDESRKDTVVKVFEWYLLGFSVYQICIKLNDEGILSPKGVSWSPNRILYMLHNLSYASNSIDMYDYLSALGYAVPDIDNFDGSHGMLELIKSHGTRGKIESDLKNRVVCVGLHPPLVEAAEWIAVQRKLGQSKDQEPAAKRSRKSWVAGLLKCQNCGHSFGLKSTERGNKKYRYYYCRGRSARGGSVCDNAAYISASELEAEIEKRLIDRAAYLKSVYRPLEKSKTVAQIATVKQVKALKQQINNYVDNIGRGNAVTDRLFTDKITALDAKVQELQRSAAGAADAADNPEYLRKICEKILDDFGSIPIDEKNKIAKKMIDQVAVSPDRGIAIKWK